MEPIIAFRNVNYSYGSGSLRTQVLYDISTEVDPGEIVILTGPSGSGKTTLLSLAGALRSVDEGSVRVLGRELNGAGSSVQVEVRGEIGFIFQAHNLLNALRAWQNVHMALGTSRANSMSRRQSRQKCVAILESVGLGDRVDYYPAQLSGGQKQRVAIARALVREPKIILADEPTASLDRASGREVVEHIHNLAKRQGCAILLVTHDNRILDIADRVVSLEDGRLSSFSSGMVANAGHLLTAFSRLRGGSEVKRQIEGLSPKQFLDVLEKMGAEFEEFLKTLDLGSREATDALFDEILDAVTEKIRDLLQADRATLFLVDMEKKVLRSKIATGDREKPLVIEIPAGTGIAGKVAATGKIMNIADPYEHPDFSPAVDHETGYRTESILSAPLRDHDKEVFAVVQLLNRKGGPFQSEDERAFADFADSLEAILESCVRLAPRSAGGFGGPDQPGTTAPL